MTHKGHTMKRVIPVVAALTLAPSFAYASEAPEVHPPVIKTVYVDRIVTNTVYVDRAVTHTVEVPVTKIVKVEVPVYETMTVTSDMKTIRAMMKVTHDRYIALLAMYRALKGRK